MRNAIRSLTGQSSNTASVVDGKLILSLPHATSPVVWQMDLTQARSSALEVRENKDTGTATLVLKTPAGEITEVAPFEKRAQALDALMAVSNALANAHGQIRPVANNGGESVAVTKKSGGKWLAVLLAIVMLWILFGVWGSMIPRTTSEFKGASLAPVSEQNTGQASDNGVPVSADDFLNNQ